MFIISNHSNTFETAFNSTTPCGACGIYFKKKNVTLE